MCGAPQKVVASKVITVRIQGTNIYMTAINKINQSISASCNAYLEHMAATTHLYQTLFLTATLTSFNFKPIALVSIGIDLL
jgi:hypothetical protein